jgi:hypothetical protein
VSDGARPPAAPDVPAEHAGAVFRALSDLGEGFILMAPGVILYANDAYCKITGYTLEELLAMSPIDLTAPADRRRMSENAARRLEGKEWSTHFDVQLIRKDGTPVDVEVSMKLLRDDLDSPYVIIVRDISDRKRAAEALRASEERLSEAQAIAHVGSWHWDIPADRVMWSDEVYRIHGLELGSRLTARSIFACIHPDDRDAVAAVVLGAFADRRQFTNEHRVVRPDGDVRWVWVRGIALTDDAGDVAGLHGVTADVTGRKRAEEQLRRSRDLFRRLSAVATVMAAAADPDDILDAFLDAARELTGSEASAVVEVRDGMCEVTSAVGLPDWMLGFRYDTSEGMAGEAVRTGRTFVVDDYQTYGRGHPQGRALGFRATVHVPLPEASPLQGTIMVGRTSSADPFTETDVQVLEALSGHAAVALQKAAILREERALRAALEDANRAKDEFLTTVSHELRTPLATMFGFLQTLNVRGDTLAPDVRADMMRRAASQAERLRVRIEGLLTLSRLGRHSPEVRAVDLASVARAAVEASGGNCRVDVPTIIVLADHDYLEIVLRNLIENAFKYGASIVSLDARADGDHAVVAVTDDGPGVPPDERDRLFDRFFRGAAAPDGSGLGIGLALVREFMESMQGSVRYEPGTPRGARFVLTLALPPSN